MSIRCIVIGTAALLASAVAPASVGVVRYVDDDAAPGGNGASWNDAFADLQDALAVARAGDVIRVAQGVYKPTASDGPRTESFVIAQAVTVEGGYAGWGAPDPDARDVLNYISTLSGDLLDDDGPNFSGNDENSYHVVVVSGVDASIVLDGVTVTAGNADAEDGPNCRGAGIYNVGGSPTIRNCIIQTNHTDDQGEGGGMFNGEGASPTIIDCAFIGNHAGWGGGMHNRAGSAPTVSGTQFIGNDAVANGGGMLNYNDSSPSITHAYFWGNTGREGGGIANGAVSSPTIENSVFLHCIADTKGGAISNYLRSNPRIDNCTIAINFAATVGGVMSFDQSVAEISNTILWRNLDPRGYVEQAQVWVVEGGIEGVNHSCVMGWTGSHGGVGNTGDDPLLIDAHGDFPDLRLSPDSAAINAGDPEAPDDPSARDLDGHYRVLCDRVDMGAYEFGRGDMDCNDLVDLADLAYWADCASGPGGDLPAGCRPFDFDVDGDTDLEDYTAFAELAFHQPTRAFNGSFCPFSPNSRCIQPEPFCVYTIGATSDACEGADLIEGETICLMPCPAECPPVLDVQMLDVPGCRMLLDDSDPVCRPCPSQDTVRILITDPRW